MADWYGTFSADSRYSIHVQAYESGTDIATNTSTVQVNVWVDKASGGGYYTANGNATASCSVDGVGIGIGNWSPYDFSSYSSKLIASFSRTVTHDADGSKTVSIAFSANDPNNFGSASIGTVGLALTTLPRASTPTLSASTIDAGGVVTINTNRLSTSFTHDIEYDFVSLTGQTTGLGAATGVTTSTTLTVPTAILSQIPSTMSGTLVVRVKTYNGATLIGTKTVNLTVTVPTAAVPTIGSLTASEGTIVPDVATLIGRYVQGVSKIAATAGTIAGVYGSTIVSTKITVDGQTISGSSGTTVNPLTNSGTYNVVAETTDSRGQVGTRTQSITVLPYTPPSVVTAEARRATVGGTVDQSAGTYIRIDMSAVVQSLINSTQKNLLQYRISTSPQGANTWTVRQAATSVGASTLAFDSYGGSNPYVLLTAGAPYSVNSPFDVKIEIIDKLNITTVIRTVAQGALLADWNAGLGLALGAYHQGVGRLETYGGGGIYQDGLPVVDFGDLATTSLPGVVQLATSAEGVTGTDLIRAMTPAADAAALLAFAQAFLAPRNHNRVINGDFAINQRGAVSGTAYGVGVYFLDRWQVLATGNAVTFTGDDYAGRVLTINSSQSIRTTIERADCEAGSFTLSWTGTAVARIYKAGSTAPSYTSSGVNTLAFTSDGSDNVRIEFSSGTLSEVQLERGSYRTPFDRSRYLEKLMLCQRFFWLPGSGTYNGVAGGDTSYSRNDMAVPLPVKMRTAPTVVVTAGSFEGHHSTPPIANVIHDDEIVFRWSGGAYRATATAANVSFTANCDF